MAAFERKKIGSRQKAREEASFARQIVWGILRLVFIACVLAMIWYVTRLEAFTIREVIVVGGETVSHEDIRVHMMDELKGTYFFLIPKQFTYLYPHDRMKEVVEKTPRAYSVDIHRTSRNSLQVSFAEYVPHALWCMQDAVDTPCMFVDSSGYAFTEAPQLLGGSLVRHSFEGLESLTEGAVTTPERLLVVDSFIQRVEQDLGLRVTSLLEKKNGDIEFYVNGGGMILVSGGKDFQATFENLKSVLSSKEFKHIKPGNFKYIDVRFDNKVFVNEELETVSTATTSTTTLPE